MPPPWIGRHPPIGEIDWDLEADARHGWVWWVGSVFDDAATFAAYLARSPPPRAWEEALREDLFPQLFEQRPGAR
jgi:hypothetical protein